MSNQIDLTDIVRDAVERGLQLAAEHVLTVANETVPHETGALERSGFADAEGMTARVGYTAPYARRQHEDLTMRHDDGRRAKWLEKALLEEAETIELIIAEQLRKAVAQ